MGDARRRTRKSRKGSTSEPSGIAPAAARHLLRGETANLQGWPVRFVLLALLIATALAFLPALGAGFLHWDDTRYIIKNDLLRTAAVLTVEIGLRQLFDAVPSVTNSATAAMLVDMSSSEIIAATGT